MKPVVFLGPSLPRRVAVELLDADYRPPAGQGDVYRAAMERPPAILLIDGIFKDAPTVRHREILWAMAMGIPVFGASSMGALRAAELAPLGMIGVGLIYRWYRRYLLLPDDAVAVTHTPRALGAQPLSDALVDIRRTLTKAKRKGALTRSEADALLADVTAKPFPNRHIPDNLQQFHVTQKADDAKAALRRVAKNDWPCTKLRHPPVIHAWMDDLRDSNLPIPDPYDL